MTVLRIVTNIATAQVEKAASFYVDVLGMKPVMDQGWIVTFASEGAAPPQISVAREGGSGAPVPDLSIEVDDVDRVYDQMVANDFVVEYGPVTEPWNVRRFFVRDPFGRLVNILAHG